MGNDVRTPRRTERGFTLVELLAVVGIIAVMAAVAIPGISRYIRNYKIRGAAQEVAGELLSARSKGIMLNTNTGVSFVVADRNSYRYIMEDLTGDERLGPLKELPVGVEFIVPAGGTDPGPTIRFNRLGGFCNPAATTTTCTSPAVPVANRCRATEATRCNEGPDLGYIVADPSMPGSGGMIVTLRETATQLVRTVRIAPGGRVLPQP